MTNLGSPSLERATSLAHEAEQSFESTYADRDAPNSELTLLLHGYRVTCENLIFADFAHATNQNIEAQLWHAHSRVNDRFRKQLKKLRESGKNLAVEKRKLLKEYLEFIKASQLFYRQFILHLDQRYGGIPAIRKEAQNWKHTDMKTASPAVTSAQIKRCLLQSCYNTLIKLGDLSRYRASHIDDKPNWSPAVGYYSLAIEVNPDTGNAHNQQAIIAQAENDHFRTLYYLYRAVSTQDGLPTAKQNLELEFKKVRSAWERGELVSNRTSRGCHPAIRALIAWFVRLHSKCYAGTDFNEHDEMEHEITSQLAVQLKERTLEGNLHKMVLINMSAEYFASTQIQAHGEAFYKSYFFFLRLNEKTFFTLLQILQPELERLTESGGREDVTARDGSREQVLTDKITTVAKRVLPAIRLYSVWFMRYWQILVANIATTMTEVDVQELFKAYTNTLTLLASAFPVEDLPPTADDYLFEEDADTIGYLPLVSPDTGRNWYADGHLKAKWSDAQIKQYHPNQEMLIRIRDLLIDGLELVHNKDAPIDLVDRRFVFREQGVPSELLASPQSKPVTSPDVSVDINDIPQPSARPPLTEDQVSHSVAPSETTSVALSKDTAMNRMVDNLVGPGPGDDGLDPLQEVDENFPPTPPAQTFEDTALVNNHSFGMTPVTARDLVHDLQGYSRRSMANDSAHTPAIKRPPGSPSVRQASVLPSLPDQSGIWNPSYPNSNPSSPYLANASGLQSRNSSSSLNAFNRGSHSRNPSLNSNVYGATYDPWSSAVTIPQTSSSTKLNGENHGFGAYLHGSPNPQYDPAMKSSFLFGQQQSSLSSPAPGAERHKSSLGRTPPNGQGG